MNWALLSGFFKAIPILWNMYKTFLATKEAAHFSDYLLRREQVINSLKNTKTPQEAYHAAIDAQRLLRYGR